MVRRFGDRGRHICRRRGRGSPPLHCWGRRSAARDPVPRARPRHRLGCRMTSMDGLFAGVAAWGSGARRNVAGAAAQLRRVSAVAVAAGLLARLRRLPFVRPSSGRGACARSTGGTDRRPRATMAGPRGSQPQVVGGRRTHSRVRCGRCRIHCRRILVAGQHAGHASFLRSQLRLGQPALRILPSWPISLCSFS